MIFRSPVGAASRPFTCHSGGLGLDDKCYAGDEGARVLNAHEPFGLAFGDLASEAPVELHDGGALVERVAEVRRPCADGRRRAGARTQQGHHSPARPSLPYETGAVYEAIVEDCAEPFREAAKAAYLQWRDQPFLSRGQPTRVQTVLRMRFKLNPSAGGPG